MAAATVFLLATASVFFLAFLALDAKGTPGAACTPQTNFQYAVARAGKVELLKAPELEPDRRGAYGGAVGFLSPAGDPEFANAAVATIDGIRRIKAELAGALTILGVSNVSFGISPHARAVLNSVFMYHCVQAGLDLAIVNPKDVIPYAEIPSEQRKLAEDLIYNRREDALARYIAYFEQHSPAASAEDATIDPMEGMEAEQRIHYQILHRKKDGVEVNIDEALTRHTPVEVLNDVLLPAMREVGDKFGAGELILPFVLQSAEVMKRAVAQLEKYLDKIEGYTKGTVVLATVFGDVHDIGKSLVNTILTNNGYTVVDLGKQVPIQTIVDAAQEHNATAIGLSSGGNVARVWQRQFKWLWAHYIVLCVMGLFLAVAYFALDAVGMLVFALPVLSVPAILGGVADAFDLGKEDPRVVARYDTAPLVTPNAIDRKWRNYNNYVDNAKALGKLGTKAREAVPSLRKALTDPDEAVRTEATTALKKIESASER